MLLRNYPDADVADVWNQNEKIFFTRGLSTPDFGDMTRFFMSRGSGPWTCVDLLIEDEIKRFAIWNETGYVYRVQGEGEEYPGSVEDDPFLKIRNGAWDI